MRKTKNLFAILLSFILLGLICAPALAVPQGDYSILMVHTTAEGAPIDGATYEILNFNGAVMGFTKDAQGEYEHGGSVTEIPSVGGSFIAYGLPDGTYTIRQKSVPSGYDKADPKTAYVEHLKTANSYFSIVQTATQTPDPSPTPSATGRIAVTVIDTANGKGIQDAEIAIYDSSNNIVERVSSDRYGEAFTGNLAPGQYSVRQTSAPSGYIANESRQSVTVADAQVNVEIKNAKSIGSAKVITTDGSGKRLSGAAYSVYNEDGGKAADLSSDANGEAYLSNLATGKYYLYQSKAPAGYQANSSRYDFEIKDSGMAEVTVVNAATTGSVTFYVTDTKGKALANIGLTIYKTDGVRIMDSNTSAEGYAAPNGLALGDYYAMVTNPGGYKADNTRYPFSVKENAKEHVAITLQALKGSIKIIVEDSAGMPVMGACYSLYKKDGTRIEDVKTDENGEGLYKDLDSGQYYVQLKNARRGIDATKYDATITGEQQAVIYINSRDSKQGTLVVYYKHIDDNREIAPKQSYTDSVGSDFMSWLNKGGYDRKTIAGFLYVKADYPTESALIDGTLTVTYWYSGKGTANIGVGNVTGNGNTGSGNNGGSGLTFDDIPEESGSYYDDGGYTPVPKTADVQANVPLALGSFGTVLTAGLAFVRRKLMQG